MTRWMPDTCGCEIEYDDDINVVAVHRKCAKHQGTASDAEHLATVLAHNRKKNMVLNAAQERLETKGVSIARAGVAVFYDKDDNLVIAGLSPADEAAVRQSVGLAE